MNSIFKTSKNLMKLLAIVALIFAGSIDLQAQVSYSQNFNANATGWTGNITRTTATTACGSASMRRNLHGGATTGNMVSPLMGTTTGGNIQLTYDYKVANWSANTVGTPNPWGSFNVQYGATATGPWTTVQTINQTNHVVSGTCTTATVTFTPPAGALYVKWDAFWSAGDYYLNFDNVSAVELVPCTTPAPGNTIASSASVCNGANVSLSLQTPTNGQTVSYQWQESDDNLNWNNFGGNTPTATYTMGSITKYFQCIVTCSVGPVSTTSTSVMVNVNTSALPEDFSSVTFPPNCFSETDVVSNYLDRNAVNGYGVAGTGSARWNFYNASSGTTLTLTTPTLSSPAGANTSLVFDVAGATYTGGEIDHIYVEESTDGGVNWNTLADLTNEVGGALNTLGATTSSGFTPTAAQWATLSFNVDAAANRFRLRGVSNFGNMVYTDNWHLFTLPPCVDPPTAGTANSNIAQFCNTSAADVTLSLTGNSVGIGQTYQWQSSPDNINWTDISGATSATYTVTGVSASTYFQCNVTCGVSTVPSASVFVEAVAPPAAGTVSGPASGYAAQAQTYSTTGSTGSLQWYARLQPATTWSLVSGATSATQNIFYAGPGTYDVMVVASVNGCNNDTAAFVSTVITLQNDNVCDAVALNYGANGPFSNVGATTESGEPAPPAISCTVQNGWCGGQTIDNTIWFSFVAPASGKIAIRTLAPLWDNQLAVYSADDCGAILAGNGILLAANDDSLSTPFHSYIAPLCVTPGATYYVQLDGYSTGTSGNINLELIDAGNTAPVVSNCPAVVNVSTDCDAATASATWSEPSVTDDCGTPTAVASHNPGDSFPIGTTTVTYTYDDGFNAPVTCSFDVVVEARISSTGSESQTACDNYTWATNGQNYTMSGAYTHTLVGANAQGCDSTVTLNLTINPLPVVTAGDVSACAGNSVNLIGSPAGGTFSVANPYSGPSTTYTYTYTDGNGCTNTSAPANIYMTAAPPVTGINMSNVGGNSATVNWNGIPGLVWYEIRYRPVGAGSWTGGGTQAAPTTFKNIISLTAGTQYEIEVRGFCGNPNFPGPWSSTTIFTTSNACVAPMNLNAINVTGTTATVTWTAVPTTNYYQIRYRTAAGPGAWVNGTASGAATSKNYTGLALNTEYEWQIRAICNPSPFSTGPWSELASFTTLASKPSVEEIALENNITVYPNPATSVVMVDVTTEASQQTVVKLYDISGRLVKQMQAQHESGAHTMTISLSELSNGMYTVQVICDDVLKHTSKISKQD
jgi:hypothetical protein